MQSSDVHIPQGADFSPAAHRNREPIYEHLATLFDHVTKTTSNTELSLLEIASGTGQHAAYFTSRYPSLKIQPSDIGLERASGVQAWAESLGVSEKVSPLMTLDVTESSAWPMQRFDFIYCANMIHISPWKASEALFKHAPDRLQSHGYLITYGPYRFDTPLSESNINFDESLKSRNPQWGIRAVNQLDQLASTSGLTRIKTIACPANNHLLVFKRLA